MILLSEIQQVADTLAVAASDFRDILERITFTTKDEANFFGRGWSTTMDSITIAAAAVGMLALFTYLGVLLRRRVSKHTQAEILEDIERYLYGNDVYLEVIRLKMQEVNWAPDAYILETVLRRFAFPAEDLQLGKFTLKGKNYSTMHEFLTYLRNYNISVQVTAEHFEKLAEKRIKINDMIDLQYRSEALIKRISLDEKKSLKKIYRLPVRPLYDVVTNTHRGHFNPRELALSKKEAKLVKDIKVPETYEKAGLSDHYKKAVADRYTWFYDIQVLPLPDGFNDKIWEKRKKYKKDYTEPSPKEIRVALRKQRCAVNKAAWLCLRNAKKYEARIAALEADALHIQESITLHSAQPCRPLRYLLKRRERT